ncbi:MAG: hypothetical protein D4R97_03155 [Bacteroidetes bacterium]|nr:MAG: hypothetical protein D4R97_03155 [Bacteroidota bacterium]
MPTICSCKAKEKEKKVFTGGMKQPEYILTLLLNTKDNKTNNKLEMYKTGLIFNEGSRNFLNLSSRILPVDKRIRKNIVLNNVSLVSTIPLKSLNSANA